MLSDKDVLKKCRYWSNRLMATIASEKRERITKDELISVGYTYGKPLADKKKLSMTVRNYMWKYIREHFDIITPGNPERRYKRLVDERDNRVRAIDEAERTDGALDVQQALVEAKLTDGEFEVIERKFWDEMNFREIACELHISPQAVSKRYRKGIGKLGVYLKTR